MATPTIAVDQFCRNAQKDLIDLTGKNDSLNPVKAGFLESILSPTNTAGFEQIKGGENGKKKTTQIRYLKELATSSFLVNDGDDASTVCLPQITADDYEWTSFDVNQLFSIKTFYVSDEYVRARCENSDQVFARMLQRYFSSARKVLETRAFADAYVLAGGYYDVASPTTVKQWDFLTGTGADITINLNGFLDFQDEMADIGYTTLPFMVGSGNIRRANSFAGYTCCNDNGIDTTGANGGYQYYESKLSGLSDSNDVFAYMPGALQFVQYNKYEGEFTRTSDTRTNGVMIDPVTGLKWDMSMKYMDCYTDENDVSYDEGWAISLNLHWEIWGNESQFVAGEKRENINGIWVYNIANTDDVALALGTASGALLAGKDATAYGGATVTCTGGVTPYLEATVGTLTAGLVADVSVLGSVTITGTPTAVENIDFDVTFTDHVGATVTGTYSIDVVA